MRYPSSVHSSPHSLEALPPLVVGQVNLERLLVLGSSSGSETSCKGSESHPVSQQLFVLSVGLVGSCIRVCRGARKESSHTGTWQRCWITVWPLGCPVYIGRRLASQTAADIIITWGLHNPFVSVLCPFVFPFVPLVPHVSPWFPSRPKRPVVSPYSQP